MSKTKFSSKQVIQGVVHLLSPFFLTIAAFYFEGKPMNIKEFYILFGILSFVTAFAVATYAYGFSRNEATGRSFRTKSGAKFNEYEEVHYKGSGISDLHSKIILIHFAIPVFQIIMYFIG